TDGQSTFVEWSVGGSSRRKRKRVFAGDTWVSPQGQTWWTRRESDKTCIQLVFSDAWLREVTHESVEVLPQVQMRDSLLAHLLRTLMDTTNVMPDNPTTDLYRESLATALVLHLVTHHG